MGFMSALTRIANGLRANDGTGDDLRSGADRIGANFDAVVGAVNAIASSQNSGLIAYATKADMDADLSKPDGALAQVTNDATTANNQSYRKSGAAGTGSWVASVDRITAATQFQQAGAGAVLRTMQGKAGEIISLPDSGAKGDGVADDTVAINAALANAPRYVRGVPGQTYKISAPLVIYSGTTLDMTGCTVKLNASSNCNMLRNLNYTGASRDSNIAVIGGTWDRGANGGTGSLSHSLFLRQIDGVTVSGIAYNSTGGKYGVALGSVTHAHVADIFGTCASDTVHLTGPAADVSIERVFTSMGGDDVVGITTTDYTAYDDVHGAISRVRIRDVSGSNTTRIVLVSGSASGASDGFDISDVSIDGVAQFGSGGTVYVSGSSAITEKIDNVQITRASGGVIRLRAANIGRILVDACSGIAGSPLVAVSPEDGQTTNAVTSLVVRACTTTAVTNSMIEVSNPISTINNLAIESCTIDKGGVFYSVGTIGRMAIQNVGYTYPGASCIAISSGSVTHMSLNNVDATLSAGRHLVLLDNAASVGMVDFQDCDVAAVDINSGILVSVASTAQVSHVNLRGGKFNGISRALDTASGSTATTYLRIAQSFFTGCNRIAQAGGGTLHFDYKGLTMVGMVNQPLRASGGASLTVRGVGWDGYTAPAVARAASEVIRVVSPDFPADLSILAKNNGDTANNTNAALACGIGPAISNGTNWKNTYSGAVY